MSAESPRRTGRYSGTVVRPQPFSDKTMMESVVDFISDVVPQAYSSSQKQDDKEKVKWVHFEEADANDIAKNPDFSEIDDKVAPLLLVIGYTNGVQVWHITTKGEAQEVLSLRQGPVRVLKVLPTPTPVFEETDKFSSMRPLLAICDSCSAGQPFCSVKFLSLKSGDEVHNISFKTLPVVDIQCNKRVVVITFQEKLAVFESCLFRQLFWVTSCYPCPGLNKNPITLGTRWLAYADKRLVSVHQSRGGMSGDGAQSYAATVISAAKSLSKGLTLFGEAMVSSVTGKQSHGSKKSDQATVDNGYRPGIVTVIDVQNIHGDHMSVNEDVEGEGLIAHFHAHANEPVAAMAFDPSGTLLVTACKLGHNFHVFRLMTHPYGSSMGAVHHLYTLHRGDTTAKVVDVTFSLDSRWVAVSTHRGTTHVFPVTCYGGPISIRTHCSPRVVNRVSRFHRSAGLDEIEHSLAGRHSPILSGSPRSTAGPDSYPNIIRQNAMNNNNNNGNPRLPPYPHPIPIYPLAQVKQPTLTSIGTGVSGVHTQSPSHGSASSNSGVSVAACFAGSRCWAGPTPPVSVERREGKKPVPSLFVVGHHGQLLEYLLEPRPKAGVDKISSDTLLELGITGRIQWNLQRLKSSSELSPPLQNNNPLILGTTAVVTQQRSVPPDGQEPCPVTRHDSRDSLSSDHSSKEDMDEQWLSQVEIITHAGPHRRLWMGPQFAFKNFQSNQSTTVLSSSSSVLLSQNPETQLSSVDVGSEDIYDLQSFKVQPARSSPVAMPNTRPAYRRSSASDCSPSGGGRILASSPLLIEAGSFEQSPNLSDVYGYWTESSLSRLPRGSEEEEGRLRETLAEAMLESPLKEGGPASVPGDVFVGSSDIGEDSPGSVYGIQPRISSSPPPPPPPSSRDIEHTSLFPGGSGSSDSS